MAPTTAADMADARSRDLATIESLREQLAAVRDMHRPASYSGKRCRECLNPHPCPTALAVQ